MSTSNIDTTDKQTPILQLLINSLNNSDHTSLEVNIDCNKHLLYVVIVTWWLHLFVKHQTWRSSYVDCSRLLQSYAYTCNSLYQLSYLVGLVSKTGYVYWWSYHGVSWTSTKQSTMWSECTISNTVSMSVCYR